VARRVRLMSAERPQGLRRRVWIFILAGVLVVAGVIAFGIEYADQHSILNSISGRLAQPSALAGSRVIKGDSVDFLIGDREAAELQLTERGARSLLAADPAFKDCRDPGRECSTPTWAHPLILLGGGDGINMPDIPGCAQSYLAGSKGKRDAYVVCVDIRSDILYYYKWDERDR
jgi:hypothetical protein